MLCRFQIAPKGVFNPLDDLAVTCIHVAKIDGLALGNPDQLHAPFSPLASDQLKLVAALLDQERHQETTLFDILPECQEFGLIEVLPCLIVDLDLVELDGEHLASSSGDFFLHRMGRIRHANLFPIELKGEKRHRGIEPRTAQDEPPALGCWHRMPTIMAGSYLLVSQTGLIAAE